MKNWIKKIVIGIAALSAIPSVYAQKNTLTVANKTLMTISEIYITESSSVPEHIGEMPWGKNLINREIPPDCGKKIYFFNFQDGTYDMKILFTNGYERLYNRIPLKIKENAGFTVD